MLRRSREPDEALGPVLDGNDQLARLERFLAPEEEYVEDSSSEEMADEPKAPQVVLFFGEDGPAYAVAKLARDCGFRIEVATWDVSEPEEPLSLAGEEQEASVAMQPASPLQELADEVRRVSPGENPVQACAIDRNHYVCIFENDLQICEELVLECLASDAAYIGVWAGRQRAASLFEILREDGAPDAELAAICCPMGLGIGAVTPEQEAVAVVAELLAAETGALKRLRYAD